MPTITKEMTIAEALRIDRGTAPYLCSLACTAWDVRQLPAKALKMPPSTWN